MPEGDTIVPALNQLAARAQLRIGSKDAHSPQAAWVVPDHAQMLQALPLANADLTWVSHCVPGTPGFELLDGLPAPLDYDYFVWKGVEPDLHPYGACYHDLAEKRSTGVIEFLRHNGIDLVLLGGLALDYCVKTTALQLRRAPVFDHRRPAARHDPFGPGKGPRLPGVIGDIAAEIAAFIGHDQHVMFGQVLGEQRHLGRGDTAHVGIEFPVDRKSVV